MMNEMNFSVILNIFCDFQLERDRPTDRQTNRQSLLQRCYGAPKNEEIELQVVKVVKQRRKLIYNPRKDEKWMEQKSGKKGFAIKFKVVGGDVHVIE